jgi:hypothetical protein
MGSSQSVANPASTAVTIKRPFKYTDLERPTFAFCRPYYEVNSEKISKLITAQFEFKMAIVAFLSMKEALDNHGLIIEKETEISNIEDTHKKFLEAMNDLPEFSENAQERKNLLNDALKEKERVLAMIMNLQ